MNSDVPKMNKKFRPERKIPKKYIKKYKNGKIAERGFFGARNFQRQKVLEGVPVSDIGILWVAFFRNFLDGGFAKAQSRYKKAGAGRARGRGASAPLGFRLATEPHRTAAPAAWAKEKRSLGGFAL